MAECERCSAPLSGERYCAQCLRERPETRDHPRPDRESPRRGQAFVPDPGLKEGQVWFKNYVEQRLPVQQITLDVEHSADVTWTFYRRHEFQAFLERCLQRLDPEEVRELVDAILRAGRRDSKDGRNTQDPKKRRTADAQRQRAP